MIEVAVSSPALDRESAGIYAEANVAEYAIVLATQRQIEFYRRPKDGQYQEVRLLGPNDVLESVSVPTVRIQIPGIFP